MRSVALGLALCACGGDETGSAPEPGEPGHDGECRVREVRGDDGLCRCPAEDVLCKTFGFAHFTISNVAGSGLPNEATYEAGGEFVTDLVTGLVWEAAANPVRMGWEEAKAHCAALELGGRADFRVPGRIELVTILDFNEVPVAAGVFDGAISDYHWTSSPASFVEGSAYTVYFGAGETTIARANPGRAVVRCVAGAVEAPPSPQFAAEADGVLDRVTGLVWEASVGAESTWDEAQARCEGLGMRLPSVRELQAIVDENRHEPALDPAVFPGGAAELVWSATLRGEDPWHVDFTDGQTYADRYADEALASRCVRAY
jgi:hypothetical protein